MKTWSWTWSGSGGGTKGVTDESDCVVLAGALEVDEGEIEEVAEIWNVVGDGENAVEGAGSVICAKDEARRTMERKRSVEEKNGKDLGHRHVVLGRLEIIVS